MESAVLAHAAGFTVLENAYWRNHTWYFITSEEWAFPDVRLIVTNAPWYDHWDDGEDTTWGDNASQVVSPEQAMNLGLDINKAEVVRGSSVSRCRRLISSADNLRLDRVQR